MDAVHDVAARFLNAGFVIVNAVVPQSGYHLCCHDLVLQVWKVGQRCRGESSGELKLRTAPANRELMRKDCAGLFQQACRSSEEWLG